jgi:hypothetical protein
MYAGVPMIWPVSVARLCVMPSGTLAMPKSSSFTAGTWQRSSSGGATNMTLWGFRSRCTMPRWCTAASASASCSVTLKACAGRSGRSRMASLSAGPSSSSMMQATVRGLSSSTKSKMSMMLGWRTSLAMRASYSSRST